MTTSDPTWSRRRLLGAAAAATALPAGRASGQQDDGSDATPSDATWPTFQYDAANTGVAPSEWGPIETPLVDWWSFESELVREGENEQYLSPVVGSDRVYVGTRSNNLYAVDRATGEHRWTFETIGTGTPAIDGDTVYVGSLDNYLYALDAASGTIEWELDAGSSMRTSPVVVDGTVYAMQTDLGSDVLAVDAATGDRLWSHTAGFAGPYFGAPSVHDGSVYAAAGDSNRPDVVSIDAESGDREWGYSTDRDTTANESGGNTLTSFGNPTAADGTVYVGSEHGYCYALSTADGSRRWEREIGSVSGSPAVAGDTVLFSAYDPARLVALDAGTGDRQWAIEFDEGYSSSRGSPIVVGDLILTTADGGALYVVSATEGTIVDRYSGRGHWLVTPAVADGVVYTAADGVHALAPPGTEPGQPLQPNEGRRTRDDGDGGSVFTRFGDSNALTGLATGSIGFVVGYLGYQRLRSDDTRARGPNRPN